MDNPYAITHVSLCAGYGGIDLGLRRAISGLRTIAFSEIEAYAVANLVAKMEAEQLDAAPIWTDVKTFPYVKLRHCVDVLSGGYPCQPFSAAGKRLGQYDPRHLWPWIRDGIDGMQPELCFFENVEGHVTLGLREVIGDLESLGYTATWGLFSAAEVGAPHQRKRVFILAHRNDAGLEGWHGRILPERTGELSAWPSGPSEPQYRWEPARVVADAGSQKPDGVSQPSGRFSSIEAGEPSDGSLGDSTVINGGFRSLEEYTGSSSEQAGAAIGLLGPEIKPRLGRLPHGHTHRVDRLRLDGNGVVPATAERAFRTLFSRLNPL